MVKRLDMSEVQPRGDRCHGVVKNGALTQGVFLHLLKIRVIDPELVAVAHGEARAGSRHLTAEFVGRLKSDFAAAAHRFFKQVRAAGFGKICLQRRELRAKGFETSEQLGFFGWGQRDGDRLGESGEAKNAAQGKAKNQFHFYQNRSAIEPCFS